ncbi:MAG: hypothetical protein JST12_19415 [Armatimonadetes bacterium]|nr:hypothetical protein [Armatimonadota bacterium]
MKYDAESLMRLLPEVYYERDGVDGPLKALLGVLAGPAEDLNQNIQQLYDDLFIETCEEWVVPYIGDLLGVRGLHTVTSSTSSMRAWVANTLGYRRRKGTLSVLRRLSRDVTGYGAAAVEMFEQLEWTQHLDHIRDQAHWIDLRDPDPLELLDTSLGRACHTVEVRNIEAERGKYNVPNIAIGLWRLNSYPLTQVRAANGPNPGEYFMDPLGRDIPMFNFPEPDESNEGPTTEISVPTALRRYPVHTDIENLRAALAAGQDYTSIYFDSQPVFTVGEFQQPTVTADRILICNLETWQSIPAGYDIGVDPKNGRIKYQISTGHPKQIMVDWSYGFSSDIGGGPYDRGAVVADMMPDTPSWYRVVSTNPSLIGQQGLSTTLDQAVADWNADTTKRDGLIVVLDSDTYTLTSPLAIKAHEGTHLLILAAKWPAPTVLPNGPRDYALISATDVRPALVGDIEITGTASGTSSEPGRIGMSGFLVNGRVTVKGGNLGGLDIEDCTFAAGSISLSIQSGGTKNRNLELEVRRVVSKGMTITPTIAAATISDSIIDGAFAASDTPCSFTACTFIGKTDVRTLQASDCIFDGMLTCARTQEGCVRYSYFPKGSTTPRAFRCQPGYAIETHPDIPEADLRGRIAPTYNSATLGHPAYRQLSLSCADEIMSGGSNGCEMGAFNRQVQQLKLANLDSALAEYMRVGMHSGVFFEN